MLDRQGPGRDPGDRGAAAHSRWSEAGYRVMEPDPRAFWMKFQSVTARGLDRAEARRHHLGRRDLVHDLDAEALARADLVLIVILIAIVVIGIMNTMWIAIRERTREIGTLRAIGMQRGAVLWMFLLESLMLGLFGVDRPARWRGAAIAAGLNALHIPVPSSAAVVPDVRPPRTCPFTRSLLVQRIVAITLVTGLAALYPSLRAARLRPVVAMSHFG